jgi:hypothetical protein
MGLRGDERFKQLTKRFEPILKGFRAKALSSRRFKRKPL